MPFTDKRSTPTANGSKLSPKVRSCTMRSSKDSNDGAAGAAPTLAISEATANFEYLMVR